MMRSVAVTGRTDHVHGWFADRQQGRWAEQTFAGALPRHAPAPVSRGPGGHGAPPHRPPRRRRPERRRARRAPLPPGRLSQRGSSTRKRVSPGCDSSRSSPWWRTTIRWAMSSPRPVPWPTGLVVKNGVEHARPLLGRDPGPVVPDLDAHAVPLPPGAQREPPAVVHGVDGVVDEVRPDLVQLRAGGLDRRQVGVEVADDLDVLLAQLVPEQRERALEAGLDVHRPGGAPGRGTSSCGRRRRGRRCARSPPPARAGACACRRRRRRSGARRPGRRRRRRPRPGRPTPRRGRRRSGWRRCRRRPPRRAARARRPAPARGRCGRAGRGRSSSATASVASAPRAARAASRDAARRPRRSRRTPPGAGARSRAGSPPCAGRPRRGC